MLKKINQLDEYACLYDIAEITIPFTQKYGPFGFYFENYLYTHIFNVTLALRNSHTLHQYIEHYTNFDPQAITFDNYFSLFFPDVEKGYPRHSDFFFGNYSEMPETKRNMEFFKIYSEDTCWILCSEFVSYLYTHLSIYKSFLGVDKDYKKTIPPEFGSYPYFSYGTYGSSLTNQFGQFNLVLNFKDNAFKTEWQANSLLEMLSLMYVMNITGEMSEEVKICPLEGCNRIFADKKKKYCLPEHGNLHRVRRSRGKKDNTTGQND